MRPHRRLFGYVLLFVGLVCLGTGLLIAAPAHVAAQTTVNLDDYAGEGDCADCHRSTARAFENTAHATTLFVAEDLPEAVAADFAAGEDVRMFQFEGDDAPRAFTLEDVAYVVGSGRVAQRFLYDAGDDELVVLPAEWNVEASEWQLLPEGDFNGETCATCHTTGYDDTQHEWINAGVTCESCHGPGWDHVEAADDAGGRIDDEEMVEILSAIITNPAPDDCASCHSQWTAADTCEDPVHCGHPAPFDAWQASPHAQQIMNDEGDQVHNVACAECHVAHPDDDEDALASLSPPQCLDCHESRAEDILSGATLVDNVTGVASAHHDEGLACGACHNAHSVVSLPEDPTVATTCTECHSDLSDRGIRQFATSAQEDVAERLAVITTELGPDSPEWVQTVVSTLEDDGSGGLHNVAYTSRLLYAAEVELGIAQITPIDRTARVSASDPTECAECHEDIHNTWQNSAHANAALGERFQLAYAESGQPSYCMSCHASGYDPVTQTYVFDGVTCDTCHATHDGTEHPPAPMPIASSSEACGTCHSGEHAPAYNEWLVSDHSRFNVDCVDCHIAHDNSMRLGDVNTTCADCHEDAMKDEVHMGEDMTCVDCHMTRVNDEDGNSIHHTLYSDPQTCASCHGDIHTLALDPTRNLDEEGRQLVALLEEEVSTLETQATNNLQSGIVGGAFGTLALVGFLFLAIRLGRIR
jgi:hypothetical protein